MCEYCKKFKDNQFKIIMDNRPIDAVLFIDECKQACEEVAKLWEAENIPEAK